ncbi:LuxR family transcriptional regulator [Streptomyces coffeae]|nr:LuxR family transcriptional regulator [Streptomyces coffeae]
MITVAGLAVQALTWCGQDEEAAVFIDRLAAHAQRDGEPQARIWASLNRTEHAWRTGDLHTAIDTGRTCLELLSSSRGDNRLALVTAPLVRALVECDQADQAVPLLAVPDGNRLDGVWHGSHLLEARARLSLAHGHLEDALADLLACGRRQTEWRRDNPAVLAWRSQAALVHLAMGDHASAQRLAEEELHQARAFGTPRAVGISLRAAGLTVRGGRGQRLVEESVGLLDEAGATLEQARSLIDLATLRFESGHIRLARELARRSLQLAQYCGATALSNRALDRLRTFGGRPRSLRTVGIQALTESERRVVVLAAQGLTNREIAQERFITQRTVENHLTSSFRKLNITGRRQLPEAVRSLDVRL